MAPPVLWQFRFSHYNEKVRWALDWKGIAHERRSLIPGLHIRGDCSDDGATPLTRIPEAA